jgi:hypothetical protein
MIDAQPDPATHARDFFPGNTRDSGGVLSAERRGHAANSRRSS